jgi:hypothetical protein
MAQTFDAIQIEHSSTPAGSRSDEKSESSDDKPEFRWTLLMVATEIGDVRQMQLLLNNLAADSLLLRRKIAEENLRCTSQLRWVTLMQ